MELKTLKIGPMRYDVTEKQDLHTVDEQGVKRFLHGHIVYDALEIRVNADQAAERKIVTLWHEAIHGLCANAGIDDEDEQVVIALGFGLVQLVRDNPELVRLTVEADV